MTSRPHRPHVMLEPRPINDDMFLEERKKTNPFKQNMPLPLTRLFQVSNVILNFLSPGTLLKRKTNKGLKPSKL